MSEKKMERFVDWARDQFIRVSHEEGKWSIEVSNGVMGTGVASVGFLVLLKLVLR